MSSDKADDYLHDEFVILIIGVAAAALAICSCSCCCFLLLDFHALIYVMALLTFT